MTARRPAQGSTTRRLQRFAGPGDAAAAGLDGTNDGQESGDLGAVSRGQGPHDGQRIAVRDAGPGVADARDAQWPQAPQEAGSSGLPTGPTTLLVIAKEPLPGRVKTRLTPPFAPQEAARLAEAALADTLDAILAAPARRRVLALDGAPGPWLPPGFDVVPQCAGGLDERLAAAFAACEGPTLLVGMDTPQVTPGLLAPALGAEAWRDCDAWFGPAADGGFWALGLARPDPELLRGVPMSRPTTGAVQRARLICAGLRVRDLPPLRDVDTAADAEQVAGCAPYTRFAATLARLSGRRAAGSGTETR